MIDNLHRTSFWFGLACLIIAVLIGALNSVSGTGLWVILGFVTMAMGVRGYKKFRGMSYTIWIFAAVTASMFYPELFISWGGFELKKLIVPLLIIIMFGMGTSMSIYDFAGVIKMPKGVFIGLMCQFSIMPIIGFSLVSFTHFPPEIAAGVLLVGCSPSGLASNVMSYISGANLALSLTLTAVATLLAPILTPFLMKLFADRLIPIDFLGMLWSIVKIVILPILAGLLFHHTAHGRFKWLDRAMPMLSMVAIAVIITIITAAGREFLLTMGVALVLVVILHNLSGYLLGFWLSRLVGLEKESCRTIAFEVGMQNAGLASGIALEMGKVATMGLAPAIFGPMMNITGSSLATWWRDKKKHK